MAKFFTNKLLLILIVFVVLVVPTAFLKQAQGAELAHGLAIGIDFKEGKYVIHAQILIPKKDAKPDENIENVNAENDSIDGLIKAIENELGKDIGFENAGVVIFTENVDKENYGTLIRSFLKRGLPYSAELVTIDGDLTSKMDEINELIMKESLSERVRYEAKNGGISVSVGKFLTNLKKGEILTLPAI